MYNFFPSAAVFISISTRVAFGMYTLTLMTRNYNIIPYLCCTSVNSLNEMRRQISNIYTIYLLPYQLSRYIVSPSDGEYRN